MGLMLQAAAAPTRAAAATTRTACSRARDNVTVVVADVVPRDEPSPAWTWR